MQARLRSRFAGLETVVSDGGRGVRTARSWRAGAAAPISSTWTATAPILRTAAPISSIWTTTAPGLWTTSDPEPAILPPSNDAHPVFDTSHPFTTGQALAAGITTSRLRGPEFRKLSKGRYVEADRRPSAVLDAEAALLGHPPEAFASHTTAAKVYGMPVPADLHEHVSVLDPAQRRRRTSVLSHVAAPETGVVTYRGVRIADPAHVFIQLAATLTLVDLVVVGDHITRMQWCSPAQLMAVCTHSTQAHAGRALAAARFVREGVDSPMETRLRMLLVLAGFPEPEVNFVVRDEQGTVRRRFDLCYPGVRVIVEYDGRQHADDPAQYEHDIYRREELDDGEWRIVVVTAKGIYAEPERTLLRVRRALRSRGMPGVPRRFHRGYRKHFPGRPGPGQASSLSSMRTKTER